MAKQSSTRLHFGKQARVYEYMKPKLRVLDVGEDGVQYAEWIDENDNDYKIGRDLGISTTSIRHIRESAFGKLKKGETKRGSVQHIAHLEAMTRDLRNRVEFLEQNLGVGAKKK